MNICGEVLIVSGHVGSHAWEFQAWKRVLCPWLRYVYMSTYTSRIYVRSCFGTSSNSFVVAITVVWQSFRNPLAFSTAHGG